MKPTPRYFSFRLAAALALIAGLLWAAAGLADDAKTIASVSQNRTASADIKVKWGIEVVAIHLAAAGNMVDFRYKVLDADKATAMFVKKIKPYLIHQKTGKVLAVPRTAKVGPLMSSYKPKKDRTYWMFFGNQSKLVQPGDAVSVVIGDFKIENLIVG